MISQEFRDVAVQVLDVGCRILNSEDFKWGQMGEASFAKNLLGPSLWAEDLKRTIVTGMAQEDSLWPIIKVVDLPLYPINTFIDCGDYGVGGGLVLPEGFGTEATRTAIRFAVDLGFLKSPEDLQVPSEMIKYPQSFKAGQTIDITHPEKPFIMSLDIRSGVVRNYQGLLLDGIKIYYDIVCDKLNLRRIYGGVTQASSRNRQN